MKAQELADKAKIAQELNRLEEQKLAKLAKIKEQQLADQRLEIDYQNIIESCEEKAAKGEKEHSFERSWVHDLNLSAVRKRLESEGFKVEDTEGYELYTEYDRIVPYWKVSW